MKVMMMMMMMMMMIIMMIDLKICTIFKAFHYYIYYKTITRIKLKEKKKFRRKKKKVIEMYKKKKKVKHGRWCTVQAFAFDVFPRFVRNFIFRKP